MTTLIAIDGHKPGGRRSTEVARRFRAELGALNITASEAARRCGQSQAWMARRTSGKTAFDVDSLDMVCTALGLSYDYVATGIKQVPGGGGGGWAPLPESPFEPSDKPTDSQYETLLAAS